MIALAASMIWAPLLYFAARIGARNAPDSSARIWNMAFALTTAPLVLAIAFALGGDSSVAPSEAFWAPVKSHALQDWSVAIYAAIAIYVAGFLIAAGIDIFKHIYFAYRARFTTPAADSVCLSAIAHWREQLSLRARPRLLITDLIHEFCVFGIFNPVILAPHAALVTTNEQDIDLMIAHEMAHIKRCDGAAFLFNAIFRAIFWFNPFAKWISREVEHQAELCADRAVINSGGDAGEYAQCFVRALQRRSTLASAPRFAPAFTRRAFDRYAERLKNILRDEETNIEKDDTRLSWSFFANAAGGVAAGLALIQGAVFASASLPVLKLRELLDTQTQSPASVLTVDAYDRQSVLLYAAGDGVVEHWSLEERGVELSIKYSGGVRAQYRNLSDAYVFEGDIVAANDLIASANKNGNAIIMLDGDAAEKQLFRASVPVLNAAVYTGAKLPPPPIALKAEAVAITPPPLTID